MTRSPAELVSRHFDDLLTEEEHRDLQEWLRSSPEHAREFARIALLHDRLRGELQAISLTASAEQEPSRPKPVRSWRAWRQIAVSVCAAVAFVALSVAFFQIGQTPAVAATELKRLIAVQDAELDRTYRIAVEDGPVPLPQRGPVAEEGRPPKPPLDGAILHVRRGRQFVLIRQMPGGREFITGSDGRTSWAIRPDGPVRVSADLTRFNRDLPGHEHDFPLMEIERGLAHLQDAYDIQLLPIEAGEDAEEAESPSRLLVAVKKRGQRGPRRVEITYAVRTGQIRQLRFLDMPYGPDRLTVRLTQEQTGPLGDAFFDHRSHHASDREIEEE